MSKKSPLDITGIEKKDIALIQLRKAIQLFNKNELISAITLAGAAEEILGKIAQKRKGYTALDYHETYLSQLAQTFKKSPPKKKDIIENFNRVRNELKHNDRGENVYITADFKFETQELIDRAIRNYLLSYDEFPRDRVIKNYVNFYWL